MKTRVVYVERKPSETISIERVFRQIAKDLPEDGFETSFQSVPYGNGLVAILKNLAFFRPKPADIYHITGDIHYMSLVLPRDRTILTIHDLIFLHRRSGLRRYILKKLYLDNPLRRLRRLTVVSDAVKQEIVKLTGVEQHKIEVIENPLIEGFSAGELKPFNSQLPVILHLGTADNKNLVRLIRAVAGINCKLRIVGRLDDKMFQELKVCRVQFANVNGLGPLEIVKEYEGADIVSFCSTYEGFGLPIIEAQAMKKPVITSDLEPMNHVAGKGAMLVDPFDVDAIRTGVLRLIDDAEYRTALVADGTANIQRFDRQKAAMAYARLYSQFLSQHRDPLPH